MYRLAIVGDVHGDVHALSDALAQAAALTCDQVVCAGDLIDYGFFPEETLQLLRERRIPTVRGNHDRWAVGLGTADDPNGEGDGTYDATGFDLSAVSLRFLVELPVSWRMEHLGVRVAMFHASPKGDTVGIYPLMTTKDEVRAALEQADADVLIVGHTHGACALTTKKGGLIVNPGALLRHQGDSSQLSEAVARTSAASGVPASAIQGGTFGILELPSERFTLHRASDGRALELFRCEAE